jgi:hypothetical protein
LSSDAVIQAVILSSTGVILCPIASNCCLLMLAFEILCSQMTYHRRRHQWLLPSRTFASRCCHRIFLSSWMLYLEQLSFRLSSGVDIMGSCHLVSSSAVAMPPPKFGLKATIADQQRPWTRNNGFIINLFHKRIFLK